MEADFMSQEELSELLQEEREPAISIFLPMAQVGSDVRGNPTQLKNGLSKAARELEEQGWREPDIEALFAEPTDLLQDTPFWQHQREGLAVFIGPDFFRTYRMPIDFEPLTVVGSRFHIKPLLPYFSGDGRFYILGMSQGNIRLLQATRHTVEELDLGDTIPASLEEALQYDDPEENIRSHTVTSGAGGQPGGEPGITHHGQGVVDDEMEQRLRRFLRKVSQGLQKRLQGEQAPLVLAGVEYLHPIYREVDVTDKLMLLDEGIKGNPEHLSAQELQEAAWQLVERVFRARLEEANTRYHNLAHGDQASADLETIVRGAVQGRVDTLFVAREGHEWGRYSPDTHSVTHHNARTNGDEDLLDFASAQTLANGGEVYALDADEIPGSGPVAAIFRY